MATDLYEISGLCVDVEYMIMGVLANNVYIVSDGEGTMVVDPSCSADKILAALGERKLDAIVLTHSHFDHTGAAAELREATGAPVIASAIEEVGPSRGCSISLTPIRNGSSDPMPICPSSGAPFWATTTSKVVATASR